MNPALIEVLEASEALACLLEKKGEYYYEEILLKRWVLGSGGKSGNCEYCEANADRGWIDSEDIYDTPMGDADGPPGHPNCDCTVEYKDSRKRVYY